MTAYRQRADQVGARIERPEQTKIDFYFWDNAALSAIAFRTELAIRSIGCS